jgi:hypothetical protein
MMYLGIPISDAHLGIKALSGIVAKIRKDFNPGKESTCLQGVD